MTTKKRSNLQIIRIGIVFLISLVLIAYFVSNNVFSKSPTAELYVPVKKEGHHSHIIASLLKNTETDSFHGEQLVHLDLKGAPPRVSYLKQFFPFIKKAGATGVLIEYEDMFFYKDELEELRAYNAYTPSVLKEILKLAESNNLTVIPLIQTFGHLEFVLKSEKFQHLREIQDYPQVLCPSHAGALLLVKKMVDQIMEAHPKSKYIHIGCDEVIYLAECERCKSVMLEKFWTTGELFLNHVKSIAMYINETYPGVRPIVWHDMISKFNERILKKSKISDFIDLMVWKYAPNVSDSITVDLLEMFSRLFKSIWIASAFKGASGGKQMITDLKYHLVNQISWLKLVKSWKDRIHFKGIALTGWQRYDHFAELCELLPVAIPSLVASLYYINNAEIGISEGKIFKLLECDSPHAFSPFNMKTPITFGKCNFPGYEVFRLIFNFYDLSLKINSHFSSANKGWLSIYNILNDFSNPAHVKEVFYTCSLNQNHEDLISLEVNLRKELSEVYDEYTVDEWLSNHVIPIRIKVDAFFAGTQELLRKKVWPRRPFPNHTHDLERAARAICTPDNTFGCALLSNYQ